MNLQNISIMEMEEKEENTNNNRIFELPVPSSSSSSSSSKKQIKPIVRKKRVITETKKWVFSKEELQNDQLLLVELCEESNTPSSSSFPPSSSSSPSSSPPSSFDKEKQTKKKRVMEQIQQKIRGYKEQDLHKKKFNETAFVSLKNVLEKLKNCQLKCFYCQEPVCVLYENVRDPKQWTLERIDNNFGHNDDNTEIACLSCNLRRKTIHFERYITTKQLCNHLVLAEHGDTTTTHTIDTTTDITTHTSSNHPTNSHESIENL